MRLSVNPGRVGPPDRRQLTGIGPVFTATFLKKNEIKIERKELRAVAVAAAGKNRRSD